LVLFKDYFDEMLQIIRFCRTGEMELAEVPVPVCDDYFCAGKGIAVGRNVSEFKVGNWGARGGAGYANQTEDNRRILLRVLGLEGRSA
jgi:hypothetical protein